MYTSVDYNITYNSHTMESVETQRQISDNEDVIYLHNEILLSYKGKMKFCHLG